MIAYLSGKIIDLDLESVVLDVNGVGYKIAVTTTLLQELKRGAKAEMWIFHVVREDVEDLYGFKDKDDLSMFKLLMTVSGIGPKSALSILNAATIETITEGVRSGDPSYLSKISGISKKNSEKIIINLRDKLGADTSDRASAQNQNTVAIDALVALGYSERESREAIQKLGKSDNPEEIIKKALKKLGGQ